jgi:selenocysteine-specific elongation factor
MPFVIGTAGHVDHGKSTLVRALSGIDPDRLQEEKDRQLTIDLGFAWFTLPNGERVGVVDVPGHRDFIENMLAGVAGMDCVILVIAADESVMPQTREHLAIIDLLDVPTGVIALSKVDTVEDEEWLILVEEDIRRLVAHTALAEAPIVPVSAQTGEGLEELQQVLGEVLDNVQPRSAYGLPRLPIDRVFTMRGFGTVVTGTLLGGTLNVGDLIMVEPAGVEGRIRGIQSYQSEHQSAVAGARVALNLSGVDVDEIQRGDVLSKRGAYTATTLVDVIYRHLPDASRPLAHNDAVKVFSGAFEVMASVRTIGIDAVQPGEEAWLQLRLEESVVLSRDDRFILRVPSPPETIGGGRILDPHPENRWPRYREATLDRFDRLSDQNPEELILYTLERQGALQLEGLAAAVGLPQAEVEQVINTLYERDMTTRIEAGVWAATITWQNLIRRAVSFVERHHDQYPLSPGVAREALRSQLELEQPVFSALLAHLLDAELVTLLGNTIRLPAFTITFTPRQQQTLAPLWRDIEQEPTAPPTVKMAVDMIGEKLFAALQARGDIVIVGNGVFFTRETLAQMQAEVIELLKERGSVTVADVRDHFQTSRKYVLGLMEYLDSQHVTRREGDVRRLHGEEDLPG